MYRYDVKCENGLSFYFYADNNIAASNEAGRRTKDVQQTIVGLFGPEGNAEIDELFKDLHEEYDYYNEVNKSQVFENLTELERFLENLRRPHKEFHTPSGNLWDGTTSIENIKIWRKIPGMKDYHPSSIQSFTGLSDAIGYIEFVADNDEMNGMFVIPIRIKGGDTEEKGMKIRNINPRWGGDAVEFDSIEEMMMNIELLGYDLPVEGLVEGRDYEMAIDWDDFQGYLIDIAEGSSGKNSTSTQESDKDFFARLADECERRILTDELSTWYDNGNYRE